MGFFLTLLYILTAYLSPGLLYGDLAQYHLEIIIAVLALLSTVPSVSSSGILRAPQTVAILGMCFAVSVSLIATGYFGGAPAALYEFLPDSFAFFLVAINCRTRRRLQLVVLTLVSASAFVIVQGALALNAGETVSPWLYDQGYEGTHVLRLRGLSIINDPNDLAQVLVSLLPCLFLFWRPKRFVWNGFTVLVPCAFLLVGVFLTHSRGALLALIAVIALGVYRKLGAIPAAIMGGATFAVSTALSWSGGREINAEAGEDRMEAWSTGFELIKSHPLFGVGYRLFTDYNNITAHNTIVVCAAELGFVGFFFWVLFVVSCMREGIILRSRKQSRLTDEPASGLHYVSAGAPLIMPYSAPSAALSHPFAMAPNPYQSRFDVPVSVPGPEVVGKEASTPQESEADIRQMAWTMVICLTGFLVAGWFLSRAYVMWLFIFGGMMQAIWHMAEVRGMTPPPMPLWRLWRLTLVVSIALLLVVYVILRTRHFFPST